MEFKKLEIKPEGSWLKRTLKSRQTKRTIIAVLIGAAGGFLFYFFTEGKELAELNSAEVVKSSLFGAFFGLFITNSPCARGRC